VKTFSCSCGNPLFFENARCLTCGNEVGWCPTCRTLAPLLSDGQGGLRCGQPGCGARLAKCLNYRDYDVCNRCVPISPGVPPPDGGLCDYCRYNDTIPDLSVSGNREKWYRLEQAKRRLLYTLDLLRLPYGRTKDGVTPGLSFDFMADATGTARRWLALGVDERVYTGHADGKITINLREADPVEREKARVALAESQRTVIGHFRHEIGHYYYQMLVRGRRDAEFLEGFGDPDQPPYGPALDRYYLEGPRPDWRQQFLSAYASAHPWEDFAETFATYLDMASVLDTALHLGFADGIDPTAAGLDDLATRYRRLGVLMNELNRALGLIDLVPEVLAPRAVDKLRFVHRLVRESRRPEG
jgi:hypothetical protein